MPLIEILQAQWQSILEAAYENLVCSMTCRALDWPLTRNQEEGMLKDIHDAPVWQTLLDDPTANRPHQLETTVLGLAVCGDGVQPFKGKQAKSHSMFCIALSVLNLPPWIRNTLRATLLAMVVPGPSEPKDCQPFLDILTDELHMLYEIGMRVWNAAK